MMCSRNKTAFLYTSKNNNPLKFLASHNVDLQIEDGVPQVEKLFYKIKTLMTFS
jgi:hypothetical protein